MFISVEHRYHDPILLIVLFKYDNVFLCMARDVLPQDEQHIFFKIYRTCQILHGLFNHITCCWFTLHSRVRIQHKIFLHKLLARLTVRLLIINKKDVVFLVHNQIYHNNPTLLTHDHQIRSIPVILRHLYLLNTPLLHLWHIFTNIDLHYLIVPITPRPDINAWKTNSLNVQQIDIVPLRRLQASELTDTIHKCLTCSQIIQFHWRIHHLCVEVVIGHPIQSLHCDAFTLKESALTDLTASYSLVDKSWLVTQDLLELLGWQNRLCLLERGINVLLGFFNAQVPKRPKRNLFKKVCEIIHLIYQINQGNFDKLAILDGVNSSNICAFNNTVLGWWNCW